jgi:sulfonate transport system substrate-binding protein
VTHDVEEAVFMASRVIVLSERPASIVADLPVDLPYPRHRGDPLLADLRRRYSAFSVSMRHGDVMNRNEHPLRGLSRRVLLAAPALLMLTRRGSAEPAKVVRVGTQKGSGLLIAEQRQRGLETALAPLGVEVKWTEFQFGPPLLEAMRAGAIDIGSVGDTPPIFSQAAHGDLLYVAALPGSMEGILLPPGSTLQRLTDLRGKRVAFGRGSSAHSMTVAALDKAGLRWDEILPVSLGPADAAAAFERGAIDAWTIWDPYYALYQDWPGVRVLADSSSITRQFSFFLAGRPFVDANPDLTTRVLTDFARVATWAGQHRAEVAGLIADGTGISLKAVTRAVQRASYGLEPIADVHIKAQQRTADRFQELGLIPAKINVADLVWHWPV